MDIRPDLLPRLYASPHPLTTEAAHAIERLRGGDPMPSRMPARPGSTPPGADVAAMRESLNQATLRSELYAEALAEIVDTRKAKDAREIAENALL